MPSNNSPRRKHERRLKAADRLVRQIRHHERAMEGGDTEAVGKISKADKCLRATEDAIAVNVSRFGLL